MKTLVSLEQREVIWSPPKDNVEAHINYTQNGKEERTWLGGNGCGPGEHPVAWMKVGAVEVVGNGQILVIFFE